LEDTPLKVSVTTAPTKGSVSIGNTGAYTYTATSGGVDTFGYRVCDADNECDTATVTITTG
jgi:hypothetical protein